MKHIKIAIVNLAVSPLASAQGNYYAPVTATPNTLKESTLHSPWMLPRIPQPSLLG